MALFSCPQSSLHNNLIDDEIFYIDESGQPVKSGNSQDLLFILNNHQSIHYTGGQHGTIQNSSG